MSPRWTAAALVLAVSVGQLVASRIQIERPANVALDAIPSRPLVRQRVETVDGSSRPVRRAAPGSLDLGPPPRAPALPARHHVVVGETPIAPADPASVTRPIAVARAPPRA